MNNLEWLSHDAVEVSGEYLQKAQAYQLQLTKPPGSLGRLEELAVRFSAYQNTLKPSIDAVYIAIMAGDHGIAEEGVSAFPQAVTAEMVRNFASGGAAISVLAKSLDATLMVFNAGTVSELENIDGVLDRRVSAGTANMAKTSAMTVDQLTEAVNIGREAVQQAIGEKAQLFIGGEMGIANTTSAACLAAQLMNIPVAELVGPGTGVVGDALQLKVQVAESVMQRCETLSDPLEVLQHMGGFEIAALVGAYIYAAQQGLPVLVDGYITTAAAMVAVAINPQAKDWMLASHVSAEPAHQRMLAYLELEPVVSLAMRLGEGSGAATVVPLLQNACKLQSHMATFAQAGVSDQ